MNLQGHEWTMKWLWHRVKPCKVLYVLYIYVFYNLRLDGTNGSHVKAGYTLPANGLCADIAIGVQEKCKQMEAVKVVLLAEPHGNRTGFFLFLLELLVFLLWLVIIPPAICLEFLFFIEFCCACDGETTWKSLCLEDTLIVLWQVAGLFSFSFVLRLF